MNYSLRAGSYFSFRFMCMSVCPRVCKCTLSGGPWKAEGGAGVLGAGVSRWKWVIVGVVETQLVLWKQMLLTAEPSLQPQSRLSFVTEYLWSDGTRSRLSFRTWCRCGFGMGGGPAFLATCHALGLWTFVPHRGTLRTQLMPHSEMFLAQTSSWPYGTWKLSICLVLDPRLFCSPRGLISGIIWRKLAQRYMDIMGSSPILLCTDSHPQ